VLVLLFAFFYFSSKCKVSENQLASFSNSCVTWLGHLFPFHSLEPAVNLCLSVTDGSPHSSTICHYFPIVSKLYRFMTEAHGMNDLPKNVM